MRRLEARYGIEWRIFWALKYRPPKDIMLGLYLRLLSAYQSELARQKALIEHERFVAQSKIPRAVKRDGLPSRSTAYLHHERLPAAWPSIDALGQRATGSRK